MKKIMTGVTLAVFALAPALAAADCSDAHDKATMASSTPAPKAEMAQTNTGKSSAKAVAKVSADKQAVAKKSTQPSKTDNSTVVAKSN